MRDNATGRRINAAPYYSQHFSNVRTYTASMTYVTGSHAMKIGMNAERRPAPRRSPRVNNDMTLVFNGATPVQAILTASPRDARERLNADLGIYAQDQWTSNALTMNLGLRFDYLNAKLQAQQFAGRHLRAGAQSRRDHESSQLEGSSARASALPTICSGNGKTAVKTSLSRYVASQTVGFASQFNPLGGTVTGAGFTGTGSRHSDLDRSQRRPHRAVSRTWRDEQSAPSV